MSNASNLPDSASAALAIASSLANCCRSCGDVVVVEVGLSCCWGKRFPSWEKAMKRVKVALRARARSWKGSKGGWNVTLLRVGLKILVSKGEA